MTSHSLDPDKIQKMRSHSLQPSSWQFVGPLRSSSFGRNARWNLNLGSRFTNRKSKKKRKKKGTKSRKLSAHGRPTIAMIILRTCTESRAQRSFRKQITTATAKFEKSMSKARDEWYCSPFVSASPSISQILFPETDCHAKTRLPDQRLWQSARPYLLMIKQTHQKYTTYPT